MVGIINLIWLNIGYIIYLFHIILLWKHESCNSYYSCFSFISATYGALFKWRFSLLLMFLLWQFGTSYLSDYWTYANEILCIGSLWRSVWDISFEILNFSFLWVFHKNCKTACKKLGYITSQQPKVLDLWNFVYCFLIQRPR